MIGWQSSDLSRQQVEGILGRGLVLQIEALGARASAHCRARAAGWWTANERELHAAYVSLAKLLAK